MKLIEDHSNFRYGEPGTNPAGGGFIVVSPESEAEELLLYKKHGFVHEVGGKKFSKVSCRLVSHAPNPHDAGINPFFVSLVRRYGWVVKGYPELWVKEG